MVQGLNPVGGGIFCAICTNPRAHPALCKTGTRSFPAVKLPEHGAAHPPPPSAGLQMGWSYISASPLYLSRHVVG